MGEVLLQMCNSNWQPGGICILINNDYQGTLCPTRKRVPNCQMGISLYLLDKHFLNEIDHKPLVPLLSSKSLDSLPPQIQRFRLCMMHYDYEITHVLGKYLSYPKNISAARTKQCKLLNEGKEEKLYQLGCVYRTPAYKVNS